MNSSPNAASGLVMAWPLASGWSFASRSAFSVFSFRLLDFLSDLGSVGEGRSDEGRGELISSVLLT